MALARLSVLKDYLNISSTSNDNTLKVLLGAATSIASNYTNRDYLEKPSGTIDEFYSPTDVLNSRLYLRNKPLNTITSFKYIFTPLSNSLKPLSNLDQTVNLF